MRQREALGAWLLCYDGLATTSDSTPRDAGAVLEQVFGAFKVNLGFPGGPAGKESACNAGDPGSIPGLERSPEGHGYPLQYSCLEKSMDRGASGLQ